MTDSPFTILDASLTAIDPSLTYNSPLSTPITTSDDSAIRSPHNNTTQSEHTSPTIQLDHLSPASTRAHSQPPEHLESWQSPRPCHPRHPYPQHEHRPNHLQRPSSSFRHKPYSHKARPPAPTSAPSSSALVDECPRSQDVEKYIFSTHQDQTTLVMGILTHLDVLAKECENMRTFIETGFGDGHEYAGEQRSKIERTRLELRNWNRIHVTELDETIKALPRFDDGEIPPNAPTTGRMVQWLDHKGVADLLDLYDLPFVPTMFLYEKKAIYLRFVGASRALMHRVLDDQPGMSRCQTDL